MSQIAKLFRTDAKTLPQRMHGVVSVGKRSGYRVYNIAEAAGRIIKPGYEIEEFIRQMSPQEMPPLLQKEYWNGQKARLAFEKELGNLWPTEDVVEHTAVLQQGIRQAINLATDEVDREEGFTTGQRKAFRRIMDAAITDMAEKIQETFKEYYANRPDDREQTNAQRLVNPGGNGRRVSEAPEDEDFDI